MSGKSIVLKTAAIVLIVIVPWILALTSILPLLSSTFLRLQYARPDVPPSSKFTSQERRTIAEACARYLISSEGIDYLSDMRDSRGLPLFNERELTHMVDVKILLWKAITLDVALGLALFCCVGILLAYKQSRKRVPAYLLRGALLTLGVCAASVIIVPLAFQWLFVEFHHLFFVGDSWLFPRSDTLIQLFPEMFWFNAVQSWVLLIISEAVALLAGTYVWIRVTKNAAPAGAWTAH